MSDRWPISHDFRAAIIRRLMQIVLDDDASKSERTSAARAILSADKMNLDEQPQADDATLSLSEALTEVIRSSGNLTPDQREALAAADRILSQQEQENDDLRTDGNNGRSD